MATRRIAMFACNSALRWFLNSLARYDAVMLSSHRVMLADARGMKTAPVRDYAKNPSGRMSTMLGELVSSGVNDPASGLHGTTLRRSAASRSGRSHLVHPVVPRIRFGAATGRDGPMRSHSFQGLARAGSAVVVWLKKCDEARK